MSSNITYWSSYVAARVFHVLKQDGEDANLQRFVPWLDRLGQLCIMSEADKSLDEMIGRLSGGLELAFLQSMASSAKTSYGLLRMLAPVFMQVAFADPTLWPDDPSSSGISLAHALASPQFELGRFILTDTIISLTFGTPPLIEYDVSHPLVQTNGEHPMEWLHGCPAQFMFSIVRINRWRAQYPNKCTERDAPWKEISDDTWAWHSSCAYKPSSESSRIITRFAAQEGWRHALLIYLYMGMCSSTSHDSRVQFSVQQIVSLHRIPKTHFATGLHLMVPLLLHSKAAICARAEVDRHELRSAIAQSCHNKTSLLRGPEFVSVLDHLWHGLAANGGPITWSCYIESRRAMLNIGV
ncbi:Fungal specific transcription factor domain [Ceratobasidium sp. AG-Ba]|nr:Fungal specific transcription factor domain [Ceratobasidium sp. AG-Ba]QRW11391.1 Fungal specific transcription factor domain [Ceratobasidium sp. AG-Ba]